jgi:hypothetical protein
MSTAGKIPTTQEVVEDALAADREASLRDMFAAAALGALIVRSDFFSNCGHMALLAYKQADVMLLARKEKP